MPLGVGRVRPLSVAPEVSTLVDVLFRVAVEVLDVIDSD